ncbi:MAG: hypothetical protein F4Y00_00870 [Bacteroidetes bacterium SB0662_bin_6]|nr:hypothetical protein [Gammaproteobacteria bacterium]MYE03519.1 hypothetical protein [Bacteroidetes bacterium SB0662_bin_6]
MKEIEGLMDSEVDTPEGDRFNELVERVEIWEKEHHSLSALDSTASELKRQERRKTRKRGMDFDPY